MVCPWQSGWCRAVTIQMEAIENDKEHIFPQMNHAKWMGLELGIIDFSANGSLHSVLHFDVNRVLTWQPLELASHDLFGLLSAAP